MADNKKTNMRSLIDSYQSNCDRIRELAETCEREKRERTEAESYEFEAICRENQLLQMKMQAAAAEQLRENPNTKADIEKIIRENKKNGKSTEFIFLREIMVVTDVKNGDLVPLNIQEILKPLEEGFILDKVGLPFLTGLAGDYVWPTYEMVEATVLGETAELGDSKIPFSKLTANPARIGVAIPCSNQSLNQTEGLLETIVREIMPKAVKQLLNKILFSTQAVNSAASTAGLVGPFVGAMSNKVALSNTPTAEQLNVQMKAAVLSTGVSGDNLCWVMTKSMEAKLELQSIDTNNIPVPMVQNHTLFGLPIYTTNEIRKKETSYQKYTAGEGSAAGSWSAYTMQTGDVVTYTVVGDTIAHALATITSPEDGKIAKVTVLTEYIGLGDWRYQPMGMFGSMRFIVDPYSQSRKDCVDFVLNCDYGTKTLRTEAFLIGEVAPSN